LAEAEDPLRIRLQGDGEALFGGNSSKRRTPQKRVRYHEDFELDDKTAHAGLVKEDIEIPNPPPRHISSAEHTLAAIMSGGERQMHGLTGRPLVYFTSIFVSLGVFLFGYDQGVMSGIIT
jgi:hypothetical protein